MVGSQGRRWGMVFCRAAALQPHGLGEDHRATCERQAAGDDAATDADRHGRDLGCEQEKMGGCAWSIHYGEACGVGWSVAVAHARYARQRGDEHQLHNVNPGPSRRAGRRWL